MSVESILNRQAPGIDAFFAVASPSTLASLIVDVMNAGTGATSAQLRLERMARAELTAIVGEDEADELISKAGE